MTLKKTAADIWQENKQVMPAGVVSFNRLTGRGEVFTNARGAYMFDTTGKKYTEYHSAFGPYLLGHCDPDVDIAVIDAIKRGESLMGIGTTPWEGELARLLIECVPTMDMVQITNSGSEATYHAVRVARAATGRDGVIVMQGGYNGWHNDVAFNLMDPKDKLAFDNETSGFKLNPISAGIPRSQFDHVKVVPFNDLDAVESIMKKNNISAIILEPILQNVGVIKPGEGYLKGLRSLCDQYGVLLIFDEVKTGFRHALGGYQSICGIQPDLSTFGKAVANGYPLGVLGGKRKYMEYFCHSDPEKRVLNAGTYNGHPVTTWAAIATLNKLKSSDAGVYSYLEDLGQLMEDGLKTIFQEAGIPATVVRQSSAFVVYFMESAPGCWGDIAKHHDVDLDLKYRNLCIDNGILHFPVQTKQSSISYAHTEKDIEETLNTTESIVKRL